MLFCVRVRGRAFFFARSDKKGDGTRSGGRGESSTGSRKHLALGAVEEKPVTAAGPGPKCRSPFQRTASCHGAQVVGFASGAPAEFRGTAARFLQRQQRLQGHSTGGGRLFGGGARGSAR